MSGFRCSVFVNNARLAGRKPLNVRCLAAGMALAMALLLAGCGLLPAMVAAPTAPIPQTPPPLPFADNPDPTLCGIPTQDDRRGIAHGEIDGELAGPIIYLYESHARQRITGQIYPGAEVQILLSQSNPTLDYYFVKTVNVRAASGGLDPRAIRDCHAMTHVNRQADYRRSRGCIACRR